MKKSGCILACLFQVCIFLNLLLLCSCATEPPAHRSLPADVPINKDAGRGNGLIVRVRMASGQKLPMIVDTGASLTVLDNSLAPRLGKRLGTFVAPNWDRTINTDVYAAPRFYLGGTPLLMSGDEILCGDVKGLFKGLLNGKDRQVMGILSMDVLENYCIQLDFAAGKMRFLDDQHADKSTWGKAFPIVPLHDHDPRPAVAENLLGLHGPHSLINTGLLGDGSQPHQRALSTWYLPATTLAIRDRCQPICFLGENLPRKH